jgi:hypothetical protein
LSIEKNQILLAKKRPNLFGEKVINFFVAKDPLKRDDMQ